MPRACALRLALAWIERKRSAPSRLAIAVRSSSGMKTSVSRVITTSMPGCFLQQLLHAQRDVERQLGLGDAVAVRARIVAAMAGVDDDAGDAEAQLARQRELAVRVRRRRRGRQRLRPGRLRRQQRRLRSSGRPGFRDRSASTVRTAIASAAGVRRLGGGRRCSDDGGGDRPSWPAVGVGAAARAEVHDQAVRSVERVDRVVDTPSRSTTSRVVFCG